MSMNFLKIFSVPLTHASPSSSLIILRFSMFIVSQIFFWMFYTRTLIDLRIFLLKMSISSIVNSMSKTLSCIFHNLSVKISSEVPVWAPKVFISEYLWDWVLYRLHFTFMVLTVLFFPLFASPISLKGSSIYPFMTSVIFTKAFECLCLMHQIYCNTQSRVARPWWRPIVVAIIDWFCPYAWVHAPMIEKIITKGAEIWSCHFWLVFCSLFSVVLFHT